MQKHQAVFTIFTVLSFCYKEYKFPSSAQQQLEDPTRIGEGLTCRRKQPTVPEGLGLQMATPNIPQPPGKNPNFQRERVG